MSVMADTGNGSGGLTPLVLVTGDEQLLVDRAITRATAAARRTDPGAERRDGTGAGLTAAEFSDLVAPSLFAEPRVVVVRGAHEASKELAGALIGYATDPVEGVWLVVHHAGGARNKAIGQALTEAGATVVTCTKITRLNERIDFVRAEIRRAGGVTSPAAVTALVEAVGSDLRELASAADQLVADTGGTVDENAVRRYHRGRAEVTGFTVSDATMSGDLAGALIGYATDPVEGVWLVVHHAGGARNKVIGEALTKAGATVLTCTKITRLNERIVFVRAEIRRAGGNTNPAAVTALVEAVGSDLRELASAADQLVADTGGTVDEKAVRRYHRGRAEVTGFTVSDATMSGDLAGALESLRWALGVGVAPVLIADALADGVRTVAKVTGAKGGNSYAIASALGMPPWKVDRARGMARGWSMNGLSGAMAIVAELNAAVKGVAVDSKYALEKAVIDLVAARRRR